MLANSQELLRLQDEIQNKRENMMQFAEVKGFTNVETIKCSQELDKLIFKYQQLVKQEKEEREVKKYFCSMIIFLPKTFNSATNML